MRPTSLTGRQPSARRSAPDAAAAASYITRITSIQSRYRTVEASRRNSLTFSPFKSWISAGSAATPRRQLWAEWGGGMRRRACREWPRNAAKLLTLQSGISRRRRAQKLLYLSRCAQWLGNVFPTSDSWRPDTDVFSRLCCQFLSP